MSTDERLPPSSEARDESGHLIRELHGVPLKVILEALVQRFGWDALADEVRINCFAVDPSIKSSLTFLRRTPWARAKVEALYVTMRTEEVEARGAGPHKGRGVTCSTSRR